MTRSLLLVAYVLGAPTVLPAQMASLFQGNAPDDRAETTAPALEALLDEVEELVEARSKLTQVMVDKIFSFSELGFQEFETSAYVVEILRENGFEVEEGISASRPRGGRAGARASRSSRSGAISTASPSRARSPGWLITTRWSKAHRGTARATTPGRR